MSQTSVLQPEQMIYQAVRDELDSAGGDIEQATTTLKKRAIPDVMRLLDVTRKGGRYDVVAYPQMPEILVSPGANRPDQIWEARPRWTRPAPPDGPVTRLDVNGAYLAAFKTHLPLGQLQHTNGDQFDRRRAGVHLITPPDWTCGAYLPNPIGNRDEPGPLWVAEPTLRLLLRLSDYYGLCDPPTIHESWTSGCTENLLEQLRLVLKGARDTAIAEGDAVTLEYVKIMYAKFVSTLGESNNNRGIYRQDWMHCIRAQAFANLYLRGIKAYTTGCGIIRMSGIDELHLTGEWRRAFTEGRGLTDMKIKE